MPTPTYTPLANITLSSTSSLVTFSSINQGFRDLVLVVSKPTGSDLATIIRFNGNNTDGAYAQVSMQGNGSTTVSYADSNLNCIWGNLYNSGGSAQSVTTFNIMDYSATDKHKSVLVRSNLPASNVTGEAGRFAVTSAITSIAVSQPMAAGSTLALYGIAA